MKEHEWLEGSNPLKMLECLDGLAKEKKVRLDRKLRLFACALWRADKVKDPELMDVLGRVEMGTWDGKVKQESWMVTATLDRLRENLPGLCLVMAEPIRGGRYSDVISYEDQCHLLRDLFGNPWKRVDLPFLNVTCKECRGSGLEKTRHGAEECEKCSGMGNYFTGCPWLTPDVLGLARHIERERDWGEMWTLAGALEEAGCEEERILEHLKGKICPHCKDADFRIGDGGTPVREEVARWCARQCACKGTKRMPPGCHVPGCWVLDLLLGRE